MGNLDPIQTQTSWIRLERNEKVKDQLEEMLLEHCYTKENLDALQWLFLNLERDYALVEWNKLKFFRSCLPETAIYDQLLVCLKSNNYKSIDWLYDSLSTCSDVSFVYEELMSSAMQYGCSY